MTVIVFRTPFRRSWSRSRLVEVKDEVEVKVDVEVRAEVGFIIGRGRG